jgi:hypothetical protein
MMLINDSSSATVVTAASMVRLAVRKLTRHADVRRRQLSSCRIVHSKPLLLGPPMRKLPLCFLLDYVG